MKKQKMILLVKPPTGNIYKKFEGVTPEYPPLGLAYMGAVLEKKNYNVKILDMAIEKINIFGLLKIMNDLNPDVVGFTATTPTVNNVYDIVKIIKKEFNCKVIIGGPHATALPDEANKMGCDSIVRGEGEPVIFKAIEENGVFGPSLVENLDELPFPARHLLPMGRYRYFFAKRKPLTNLITSRGCPFNCVFCNKQIMGRKFRARSSKNVVDELEHLVNDFGIKEVHISDDAFSLNEKRVIEICDMILERGLDLTFHPHNGIRVDTVTEPLLNAMKKAGFYSLPFGFESGNQNVLDDAGKAFTLKQARNAVKLCKRYGFEVWGFFIFGLPADTEETMRETIEFAKELDIDVAKFHVLVPFPGSEVYRKLKLEKRILIEEWSDYCVFGKATFVHPKCGLRMSRFLSNAYREFYIRPHFILKTTRNMLKSPERFFDIVNILYSVCKKTIVKSR